MDTKGTNITQAEKKIAHAGNTRMKDVFRIRKRTSNQLFLFYYVQDMFEDTKGTSVALITIHIFKM